MVAARIAPTSWAAPTAAATPWWLRHAADYDGIVAGAPGANLPTAAIASIAGAQLYATIASVGDLSPAITSDVRRTMADAILAKCDALDGATDGMVQDVEGCRTAFDLQRDVPGCADGRTGSCLTPLQKSVISAVFGGATTSSGARIYATFPYDVGATSQGLSCWEFVSPLLLDSGAVGLVFKVPPESAHAFSGLAFALGADLDLLVSQINATDPTYTESAMSFATPPSTIDMSALKNRGASSLSTMA